MQLHYHQGVFSTDKETRKYDRMREKIVDIQGPKILRRGAVISDLQCKCQ